MPQPAAAFSPAPQAARPAARSVADAITMIAAAGITIADLAARLTEAEQAVALLQADKRRLQAELCALERDLPPRPTFHHAEPASNRSHLDNALAAVVDGLGPDLVRLAPRG